ncbi:sideroflexin-1-3 [Choristoneura fumiferana]|uniref:sideroflexin-1-3 n=1 Tax=Choristoneura fumiferana TaxID=7141 RepID=UPI003D15CAC6
MSKPIDLNGSRYDQDTYIGRAKHFFMLTNPMNIFATAEQLQEAKKIVETYQYSKRMPEGYNEDKLWSMKYLYDSAHHPDTGDKMFVLGRMAAQAPMNTLITGCMITFYKTTASTVFWQWFNQTFNAVVNYTNRSGTTPISKSQLLASYCCACGGALGTALFLNSKVKHMKPVYASMVPFAAVCGANFINIPMMRSNELIHGATVFAPDGTKIGESKNAARLGIFLVCVSRCFMAVPGMTLTPLATNYARRRGLFCNYPNGVLPFQLGLVGLCVLIATPLCCALFKQKATLSVTSLEPELQAIMKKRYPKAETVYFNKGL